MIDKSLLTFFLLILSLSSCKSTSDQMQCLDNIIKENEKNEYYNKIKTDIKDSIYKWESLGLKNTKFYNDSLSVWYIDAFLFNQDSTKIFGWLLMIDKEKGINVLDYAEYFTGEKIKGDWFLYIKSMPSIWFDRENNNGESFSWDYMSERAKVKIINGGIFKFNSCDINYEYINLWIDREDKERYKWHQEFLNSGSKEE